MKKLSKFMVLSVISLLVSGAAFGSGFAIYEHSARAMGMAGAFAARASDPSAIFFNPAGLTELQGTHFYGGATLILHGSTFKTDGITIESDDKAAYPPNFYITQQLSDKIFIGAGVNAPFGLSKTWPLGNNLVYSSQNADMQTIFISGALAIKLTDSISLGGTVSYVTSNVTLERYINIDMLAKALTQNPAADVDDVYLKADVSDNGVVFTGGLQWKITPSVIFGASYHSGIDLTYEGDATFGLPTIGVPQLDALLATLFPDQSGTATISFGDQIFAGLAFLVGDKWEFEFDCFYTFWSRYEELTIDFEENTALPATLGSIPILQDVTVEKNWEDSWSIRGGAEYHASPAMDLRFGVLYDLSPVPDETLDPMLPDANRFAVSAGLGYHKSGFIVDFAYMALFFEERSATNNALVHPITGVPIPQTYEATLVHLIALNIGYSM